MSTSNVESKVGINSFVKTSEQNIVLVQREMENLGFAVS